MSLLDVPCFSSVLSQKSSIEEAFHAFVFSEHFGSYAKLAKAAAEFIGSEPRTSVASICTLLHHAAASLEVPAKRQLSLAIALPAPFSSSR